MEQSKLFKDYQERLMVILSFFDKLCRDNNIKYTVLDGTLLGTIRHHGMIPWDGDIDVALTPKELEKLKKVFENYNGRYYLNYIPGHFYKKKGRIHNFPTLTAKIIDKQCNSDLYGIDVFTIDLLGDDKAKALSVVAKYKRYANWLRFTTSFHIPEAYEKGINIKRTITIVLYPFYYLFSRLLTPFVEKLYLKFRERNIDNNQEDCKYFTIQPYLRRIGVEYNNFLNGGYIDMPFGNLTVMVAKGYEVYLRGTYGDYMKLPPEDKRIPFPSEESLVECKFEE